MEPDRGVAVIRLLDQLATVLEDFDIHPATSPRRTEDEVRLGLRTQLGCEPNAEVLAYFTFVERYDGSVNIGPHASARAFDDPDMVAGGAHLAANRHGRDDLDWLYSSTGHQSVVFAGFYAGDLLISPACIGGPTPRVLLYSERVLCFETRRDGRYDYLGIEDWEQFPTLTQWLDVVVDGYRSGRLGPQRHEQPEYPWTDVL